MSAAIQCDNCGAALGLDQNGEDEDAEVYAWIRLGVKGENHADACSRACAHDLLDGEFGAWVDAKYASVARIARIIKTGEDPDDTAEGES